MKSLGRCVIACVVLPGVLAAGGCARVARPAGEPKGVVSGVVKDPAGVPVPSIWIRLEKFMDPVRGHNWVRSDIEGRFVFEDLPEGKVAIRVAGAVADIRTGFLIETTAGTKDLAVVVEPGPQVLARIAGYEAPQEGEARYPLGYARLVWLEADGNRPVRYAPVSEDGRARFVQLPRHGSFELWTAAGNGRAVRAAGLRAGEVEVTVEAKEAKQISGKVLLPAGDPNRPDVTAAAYPGFVVGSTRAAADGTFSIGDLPDGTYTVIASFNWGAVADSLPVTVPAGAKDVVLDLTSR